MEGRSTGSVIAVSHEDGGGGLLQAVVLGDSGFMVLSRDGGGGWGVRQSIDEERIEEQQHYFNCPLQQGSGSRDRPEHGARELLEVRDGDLILMATDGVFDNHFDDEMAALLAPPLASGDSAQQLAEHVARSAVAAAVHPTRRTPFSASARSHGYKHDGGKLDDVTVVCVRVIEAEAEGGGGGEAPRSKL